MAFDFPASPAVDQIYNAGGGLLFSWDGAAWRKGAGSGAGATPGQYVLKAGDTMLGFLTLNATPTQPLHAATKAYVDAITQNLPTGLVGQALVVGVLRSADFGNPIQGGSY